MSLRYVNTSARSVSCRMAFWCSWNTAREYLRRRRSPRERGKQTIDDPLQQVTPNIAHGEQRPQGNALMEDDKPVHQDEVPHPEANVRRHNLHHHGEVPRKRDDRDVDVHAGNVVCHLGQPGTQKRGQDQWGRTGRHHGIDVEPGRSNSLHEGNEAPEGVLFGEEDESETCDVVETLAVPAPGCAQR